MQPSRGKKPTLRQIVAGVAAVVLTYGLSSFARLPNVGILATAPSLGAAQSFAVLAASTVTNTGPTIVTGDLGVSPGTAVTGFPPGFVNGTIHSADAVAIQAQTDVTTAYNNLGAQPCNIDLTGQNLGGLTLTPGVYCFSSSAQLTGTLTLDAMGNPSAVFIFKMGSTITTASNANVVLINGASDCNVFWQVGSSATLGTGTNFEGNILAFASITLTTGARLSGRALARTAAVTMDSNVVTATPCTSPSPTPSSSPCPNPTPTLTPCPGEKADLFNVECTFIDQDHDAKFKKCKVHSRFQKAVTLDGGEVTDDSVFPFNPEFEIECDGNWIQKDHGRRFTEIIGTRIQAEEGPYPALVLPRGALHEGPHSSKGRLELDYEKIEGSCFIYTGPSLM